ncbi:hypothetical protein BSKO_07260 [Bryopsis sp. KO-2023]|nr:hypothetical protein BSKO_07260 [Bryopsis sp. KO-2023]
MAEGKAKIDASNAGDEVLGCFWGLSSEDEGARISSAQKLVQLTLESQQEFENSNSGGAALSALTVYVLERLLGGLKSGRHSSHVGCSTALVAVLEQKTIVSFENLWALANKKLVLSGSMRGEALRDACIGRALFCSSIIRSGILSNDLPSTLLVAKDLTTIYSRKAAMREICSSLIVDLVKGIQDHEMKESLFKGWTELGEIVEQDAEDAEPEDLLICLNLWDDLPQEMLAKCEMLPKVSTAPPRGAFESQDKKLPKTAIAASEAFFTGKHLQQLEGCLKRTVHSHPRMHSVWKPILEMMVPNSGILQASAGGEVVKSRASQQQVSETSLIELWKVISPFGHSGASEPRQFLLHKLFRALLPHLSGKHLPVVLGDNFLPRIVHQASTEDDALMASAKECLKAIKKTLHREADSLTSGPTLVLLQRLSKHKDLADVCESILVKSDSSQVDSYLSTLMGQFLFASNAPDIRTPFDDDSEDEATYGYHFSLEHATRDEILKEIAKVSKMVKWNFKSIMAVVQFLVTHGIFRLDSGVEFENSVLIEASKCSPPISAGVKEACKRCLASILPILQYGTVKCDVKEEMLLVMTNQFIADCNELEGVSLSTTFTDAQANSLDVVIGLTDHLADVLVEHRSKHGNEKEEAQGRKILSLLELCLTFCLYLWIAPESVQSNLVDDLARVVAEGFGLEVEEVSEEDSGSELSEVSDSQENGGAATGGKEEEDDEDMPSSSGEDHHYADGLVQVVLSINARSTAPLKGKFLRDQAMFVFCSFARDISLTGWLEMLDALNQGALSKGFDPEVDNGGEEEEVEVGLDDDSEDESEDSGDENEGAPSGMMENGFGFHQSDGDDSQEEEDSDFDDETMFKMDDAIAAVLRARKDERDRRQGDVKTFVNSTLACVKHFLKMCPDSPLAAFAPGELSYLFLKVEEKKDMSTLAIAAEHAVKLGLKCKVKISPELVPLMEERAVRCLKMAGVDGISRHGEKLVGQALRFMVRSLWSVDEDASMRVVEKMMDAVFAKNSDRLDSEVLQTLMLEVRPIGLASFSKMTHYVRNARNDFLKIQALKLLNVCLGEKDVAKVEGALREALSDIREVLLYLAGLPLDHKEKNVEALQEGVKTIRTVRRLLLSADAGDDLDDAVGKLQIVKAIKKSLKASPPKRVEAKLNTLAAAFDLSVTVLAPKNAGGENGGASKPKPKKSAKADAKKAAKGAVKSIKAGKKGKMGKVANKKQQRTAK